MSILMSINLEFMILTGIEQDTLGGGSLTSIDMRHDTDIASQLQRILPWHLLSPFHWMNDGASAGLPAEVGEGLVGLSHLMDIVALLDGAAGAVHGVHDLAGQALFHRLFAAAAGIAGDPAQTQGLTAVGTNIHRHLIVGAAHAAGLDLQNGHDILHGRLKGFAGVFTGFFLNNIKSAVDDLLSNALLAVQHDIVDKLGHQFRILQPGHIHVLVSPRHQGIHLISLLPCMTYQ